MKLMIVDDEKLLRNGFKYMTDWSSKGIDIVAEAMNGIDALDKIQQYHPDVVLTDINMPVMNGIELTKAIKQKYPHIIVIILSGYDDYNYIRESMKSGASDYLLKAAIDVDEIVEMLNTLKVAETKALQISTDLPNHTFDEQLNFDKEKIDAYIELQQFEELKVYIIESITSKKNIPYVYLRDILRDLFFFIQYRIDQLNLFNKHMKGKNYLSSSSVNLIIDNHSAIEWVNLIIDGLANQCKSNNPNQKEKFNRIIQIIDDSYTQPGLSLTYIADQLFMNKNYLCDVFKSESGTTINQYINDVRILKAKSLIRENKDSLQVIAEKVGFSEYNYFSRVFRKKMGIPPTEYQKIYL